jgi:hypothetical protein
MIRLEVLERLACHLVFHGQYFHTHRDRKGGKSGRACQFALRMAFCKCGVIIVGGNAMCSLRDTVSANLSLLWLCFRDALISPFLQGTGVQAARHAFYSASS